MFYHVVNQSSKRALSLSPLSPLCALALALWPVLPGSFVDSPAPASPSEPLLQSPGAASCAENPAARAFPRKETLIPGELTVTIYKHEVKVPGHMQDAWTYVSEGLAKFGQDEIAFTVLKSPGEKDENYPQDPLIFYRMLPGLAKQNKIVKQGSITEFGPTAKAFLAPQFKGIIYLPAAEFTGVTMPARTLAAVPITSQELAVYHRTGPGRVAGRLTKQGRLYPYSTWCDRKRQTLFNDKDVAAISQDLLAQAAMANAFSVSVMASKGQCSLYLPEKAGTQLAASLNQAPKNVAIMLSTGVDPRANAHLVWTAPGNDRIDAVGPDGSDGTRISGSFLEIVPGVDRNECRQVEDGYMLMLTKNEWARFKQALSEHKEFALETTTGQPAKKRDKKALTNEIKQFALFWDRTPVPTDGSAYKNPVDGKTYDAPGGWHVYRPEEPRARAGKNGEDGKIIVDGIVLLTDEKTVAKSISAESLAGFIKRIEDAARTTMRTGTRPRDYEMLIQTELTPGNQANYQIAVRPESLASRQVQSLHEELKRLPAPPAGGTVKFQLKFTLKAQQ